jgi:hypothetical protein
MGCQMKFALSLALVLAMTAWPALASAPAETKPSKPDREEVICKSTFVVDSKIPTRICRSRQQWEDIEREHREARRRSGTGSSRCADGGNKC